MQTPGTYISAIAHGGLIVWLIAGWGFSSDPLDFEVSDVSVVTSEEYAALLAATTPDPGDADPVEPVAPVEEPAPELTPPEDTPPPEPPTPATPPAEDAPPPPPPAPPPPPEPAPETPPEVAPPAEEQAEVPAPLTPEPPAPRPAERIAPEPVAPPEPEVEIAEAVQEEVTEEPAPEPAEPEEPQEAAAPEETATRIVTEADAPSGAVETSLRPQVRPNRPAPAPEPEPETQVAEETPAPAEPSTDEAAIAAALEAATAATDQPAVPQGPPMTSSEREGFRIAVNRCWTVDPGSQSANVVVTVAFSLDQSGKVSGNIRQIGASEGSAAAVENAFQKARRAILRCQGGGYQLPADKYGQWKDVEITFDPTGMRQL